MEIGDRFQGLNEVSDLSETDDDQQTGSNLIDISESEIFFRNKSSAKRSKRGAADKPNYNSFQLSNRQAASGRQQASHQAKYRSTHSLSSDETVLESTENDSLLQEQQSNRNKIQLNPIREWVMVHLMNIGWTSSSFFPEFAFRVRLQFRMLSSDAMIDAFQSADSLLEHL